MSSPWIIRPDETAAKTAGHSSGSWALRVKAHGVTSTKDGVCAVTCEADPTTHVNLLMRTYFVRRAELQDMLRATARWIVARVLDEHIPRCCQLAICQSRCLPGKIAAVVFCRP